MKGTGQFFEKFESECVKAVLFEDKGCLVNYHEELLRLERKFCVQSTTKKRKRIVSASLKKTKDGGPLQKKHRVADKAKAKRLYSPSSRRGHDEVKKRHNETLCQQFNEMVKYYRPHFAKVAKPLHALFLDSVTLTTQQHLQDMCSFTEEQCLVPNKFEYSELCQEKKRSLFNCSVGSLLQSDTLKGKRVPFVWLDYMNSLDGTATEVDESSPRQDMTLYFSKHAQPFTLFAVTLCLRHCKYNTHDYSGGTEVVIMRTVNDLARDAGLYFSIIPPTGTYGSNMFLYAGILLPLDEKK
jgi:hypothetical protein